MLKIMEGLPEHVVGVHVTGTVTKQEVENIIQPAIEKQVQKQGKIYYLLVLDTELKNIEIGAWLSDAKKGLQYFTKWTKIAVVTDIAGVNHFIDMASAFVPGETKGFKRNELEAAKQWLAVI